MNKSRLETLYNDKLRAQLRESLNIKNIMDVPKISKVVLNVGAKSAVGDSKKLEKLRQVLEEIAGQKVVRTTARKSIAGFKLREGMSIGLKVTLRRDRMFEFLDRLLNVALPNVRDFQGVSSRLDSRGNYNMGVKDWMIFPEVEYGLLEGSNGMNITIQTTAQTDEHGKELLKAFGMPFKK